MKILSIVLYLLSHFSDIEGLLQKFLDLIHGVPVAQRGMIIDPVLGAMAQGPDAVKQAVNHLCNGTGMGCEAFKGSAE